MKCKIIGLIFAVLFLSCKKTRTCECVTTSTYSSFTSTTNTYETEKVKKADAASTCDRSDFKYRTGDPKTGIIYDVVTDCSYKK